MMWRYLVFLSVSVGVLAASMVVGVGVSAFLLAWHLDMAPQYHSMTGQLWALTAAYAAVAVPALLVLWAHLRRPAWRLPLLATTVATLGLSLWYSVALLKA